ncbi:MAG: chemotaxis protein CheW [Proteobacteria bacterium]|nr:chemotaxis protein CheW [Pseudomonadota bacterium]
MSQVKSKHAGADMLELATFYVGAALCGLDILKIQEINKQIIMTKVPQAPEYVMGILNLRGQIVTVIDLGVKLGLAPTQPDDKTRNIIVNSKGESIGLLVERISDVVPAEREKLEPPPANIGGVQGKFFKGVFKTPHHLIAILDVEEILKEEH